MMKEKRDLGMASNDERTPLIQVVGVRPRRDRYEHQTVSSHLGCRHKQDVR